MKRALYKDLLDWKNSNNRKPLLLQGARQVGKTYLVNEFGKNEYKNYVNLNFEQNANLASLFTDELSPEKIIHNISLFIGRKITSENTLLFFDEIQTVPEVLTSLKYFYEQAPEYHIIAAGSLLGVSIGKKNSFPVGKVNFMKPFVCKCLFLLPIILFVDYIILALFGATSCLFGAGESEFCSVYAAVSIMFTSASLVFFVGIIAKKNKIEVCDSDKVGT